MRFFVLSALLAVNCPAQPFGTWRVNVARSTFEGGTRPKSLTVRIEPHVKGEVFTFDRVESDGSNTSSSTILYLDEKPRDFQEPGCSGTQSSRRVDARTVEILRKCGVAEWTKYIRRASTKANELVLEVSQQHADGRHSERRLTLERQ